MENITEEDIQLLFGSLVMLPQDLVEDTKESESKKGAQPLDTKRTETEAPKKETNVPKTTKREDITTAEEPKAIYESNTKPLILLTTTEQKEAYLLEGSPLRKILDAHKVPNLANYLSTDTTALQNTKNYECIWTIGLSLDLDKTLLQSGHTNALTSPNLLQLRTKDDKMAMYGPLKEFLATNLESFSKL